MGWSTLDPGCCCGSAPCANGNPDAPFTDDFSTDTTASGRYTFDTPGATSINLTYDGTNDWMDASLTHDGGAPPFVNDNADIGMIFNVPNTITFFEFQADFTIDATSGPTTYEHLIHVTWGIYGYRLVDDGSSCELQNGAGVVTYDTYGSTITDGSIRIHFYESGGFKYYDFEVYDGATKVMSHDGNLVSALGFFFDGTTTSGWICGNEIKWVDEIDTTDTGWDVEVTFDNVVIDWS